MEHYSSSSLLAACANMERGRNEGRKEADWLWCGGICGTVYTYGCYGHTSSARHAAYLETDRPTERQSDRANERESERASNNEEKMEM